MMTDICINIEALKERISKLEEAHLAEYQTARDKVGLIENAIHVAEKGVLWR